MINKHEAIIHGLTAIPYLAGLNSSVQATISPHCRTKSFRGGQIVFVEGNRCEALYTLESGQVKCYRTNADGREQVLKVFNTPGDTFCIPSAWGSGAYVVSAMAVPEARLHSMDVATVKQLSQVYPSVAFRLLAAAGDQMGGLAVLAGDFALKTAIARLAEVLYELAKEECALPGNEIHLCRDRLPSEELASRVGTVRVHVSRALKSLAAAGVIRLSRNAISIPDLESLKLVYVRGIPKQN